MLLNRGLGPQRAAKGRGNAGAFGIEDGRRVDYEVFFETRASIYLLVFRICGHLWLNNISKSAFFSFSRNSRKNFFSKRCA